MNNQITALRRMTVENGCTEAEAATAKTMLKRLLAKGDDLSPEDKLRFKEIQQRYSQRVEALKRELAASEEEMSHLLRRYPLCHIESDKPMSRALKKMISEDTWREMITKSDKSCARYKYERRWNRWKREQLFTKLDLDWEALAAA